MVELELFQGGERPVALLCELEPPSLELAGLVQQVARGSRLADERPCDEDDRRDGQHRGERQRDVHTLTASAAYRSASRRCSTASGHMATSEPKTNTKPAAQRTFTRGFTSTLRNTVCDFGSI